MKKDTLNFLNNKEQIGELIAGKSYIIYFLSELKMGKNADLSLLIPEEEILEAHFFDQREYIHLFELDDKLQAAVFKDGSGEDYISEIHVLQNSKFRALECRKYVSYDEYGQAYIEMVRPAAFTMEG